MPTRWILLILNLDLVDKMHLSDISRAYVCAHAMANDHVFKNIVEREFRRDARRVQTPKLDPRGVFSLCTRHEAQRYTRGEYKDKGAL